ncbi:MAG: energy-coupling factor transporter ATPase [Clostridia bacterium]|nr:energy-coupling factor transporter ATPase [Clostridia bacterium]
MSAIELKHLTFVYSKKTPFEKRALDDINLSVEEGTFLGVIGETGSGKSTLIQHLNGLIKVQDKKVSSVIVNGLSATDKKALKNLRFEVGIVFQYPEYQLFEDSVKKDVAFGPKNMKLSPEEIDARVRRALEVVGLDYDEFAERSPFELSGGEKRRVAIAGVIAMEPKILVLDEPVAGLDPAGRAEILALIKQLQKDVSPTIIMVSHNMDDIAVLADRIIAMHDGRIELDGTPEEVFCNREKIAEIGLDLPLATRLRDKLVERGVNLPDGIVTPKQLETALANLKSGGLNERGDDNV